MWLKIKQELNGLDIKIFECTDRSNNKVTKATEFPHATQHRKFIYNVTQHFTFNYNTPKTM